MLNVIITNRKKVLAVCEQVHPTHIISINNIEEPFLNFPTEAEILFLRFNDEVGDSHVSPSVSHVTAVLDFIKDVQKGTFVVHCTGGSCRSGSVALAIIAAKLGLDKCRSHLSEKVGHICPNEKLSHLFDIALDVTFSRH